MIEQMKNKNEYREDGNLYVKTIKSCICCEKSDDIYTVTCDIHQRGSHRYHYCKAGKWITKPYSNRRIWLAADAEATICKAVELFDEQLDCFINDGSKIIMEDAELAVFLKKSADKLDCVIQYYDENKKQTVTELRMGAYLEEILHHLQFLFPIRDCKSKELLYNPTKENIMMHPFIIAAQREGDIMTEKKIKMYYQVADTEDCKQLEEILGLRILPSLPEEYDREYYIASDTVTKESYALLSRSGYNLLHRPYFAMKGSTHSKITLNPHTKMGVDAAKISTDSISFDEYLNMFGN